LGTGELITFYFSPVQVTTNTNWSSLSLGSRSSHNFLLTTGNALYGIGYNGNGQLGSILDIAGANVSLVSPVQLGTTDWSIARNGATSTLARKTNGTLWAWGRNNNGQLGQGNVTDRSSPVQIGTATDWSSEIASARYSGFAIKTGGTLWAWGLNTNGRLGINSSVANTSSPIQVGTGTDWSNVSAGANHTLAVKTNGTLWAWGTNTYGQLGINNATNRSSPVQVGTDTNWSRAFCNTNTGSSGPVSFAIKTNGTLWAWGRNAGGLGVFYNQNATAGYVPVQIGTGTDWASAGTGIRSSFAIKTGGTLWAWGYNSQGVLGLGDVTTRSSPVQIGTGTDWSKVDGSRTSTFAIKTGGTLWAWGYNGVGQLGQGNTTVRSSPVQVGTGTDWSNISASGQNVGQFVLALKTGGTLWSWGGNGYGQLGLGDTTNRSSPVQVGTGTDWAFISAGGNSYNALSSFAIKTNGTLWAWGSNYAGVLGLGDTTNRSSPVQVGTDTNWSKVSNGGFTTGSTLAIKTNGTLWAWGRNNYGQLGLGDTTVRSSPVQVGTDTDWTQVVSSTFATLAVKTNGTLWSWGSNGNANSYGLGEEGVRDRGVSLSIQQTSVLLYK
jgi:alpha-tubulin suppressor-like RCC1 family protein